MSYYVVIMFLYFNTLHSHTAYSHTAYNYTVKHMRLLHCGNILFRSCLYHINIVLYSYTNMFYIAIFTFPDLSVNSCVYIPIYMNNVRILVTLLRC